MNTKKKTIIGISAIAIVIILALVGSRLFSKKLNNPYEIMVNGKILSIYDSTKEDFEENGFEIYDGILSGMGSENNSIEIYNDEISAIMVHDDSVKTYNSISVGDDISKVVGSFEYEFEGDNTYAVYFNKDGKEIKSTESTNEGCAISYTYNVENLKVEFILIANLKVYGN